MNSSMTRVGGWIIPSTLFFIAFPLFAEPRYEMNHREQSANAMVLAGREMVIQINLAAKSGDLNKIREHAKASVRYGKKMISHGRTTLALLKEDLRDSEYEESHIKEGQKAITHIKEAIKHGKTAIMHAHHAVHSDSLRSGLSHAREGAKHARISGLYAIEGETSVFNMM